MASCVAPGIDPIAMRAVRRILTLAFVCCLSVTSSHVAAASVPLEDLIRVRVERLKETGTLTICGTTLAAVQFIPAFYEQRQFRPAWTDPNSINVLFAAIAESWKDGLDPEDFHARPLKALAGEMEKNPEPDDERRVDFDILLTDSLARLGSQLFYGKVDPKRLDASWNFERPILGDEPVTRIESALASGRLAELIDNLRLDHPIYGRLKSALEQYRRLQDQGGWPAVEGGPALKRDMEDPRVRALRRRLRVTGDDGSSPTDSMLFDEALGRAVKRFQNRHGLTADGVIGRQTIEALNVPVQARIDQIRVNLEQARWVLRNLDEDFIVVNIASFETRLVRRGEVIWKTPAIVGEPYRKTPVFKSKLTSIVFNPTWTVPRTILRNDVLPRVKADRSYLAGNNLRVRDRNGEVVDPADIDWVMVEAQGFPYRILQAPGPRNALGPVKFLFPNEPQVYLHGTPRQELFDRSERAFSSGCIRVKNALKLAELLLQN